jgi:hypothetical protein
VIDSLAREDRILLCAAHPVLSAEQAQLLAGLLRESLDWRRLVDAAERHGVAPLLHDHVRVLPAVEVPADLHLDLERLARACVAWNMRLRHELGHLLSIFHRAAIDVMPLKGPVLADQLYREPLLRSTEDLDVLVRPEDFAAAERVLEAGGYRRLPAQEQGAAYHTRFVADRTVGGDLVVELHSELGEAHVSGLDVRAIWADASRAMWQGHALCSMSLPDLLLYLCVHAAKDGLASVRSLVDITLLAQRHGSAIRWDDLAARVKAAHIAAPVYLALAESRGLLGAPVPAEFLDAIRPRHPTWRLAQALFRWRGGVMHVPEDLLVGPVMALLMLLWEDTPRRKIRHLRRNLIPSPALRGRWTCLPASWPLWYPVWIWRATRHAAAQVVAREARGPAAWPHR